MDVSILVKSLREVPETRLKLLEIAREAIGEDGALDQGKVALRMKEVKEAADEAEEYAHETGEVMTWLTKLIRS